MAEIRDIAAGRALREWASLRTDDARAGRYIRDCRAYAAETAGARLADFRPTRRSLDALRRMVRREMERCRLDEGDLAALSGVPLEVALDFLSGSDVVDPFDALRLAAVASG